MIEAERRIREALSDEALFDEGASVSDTLYAAHVFEEVCTPENISALLAELDRLTRERDEIAARLESAVDALTHKRPLMTTAKTVDDWRRIAEHLDFEWSECSRHLNKVATQRDEARAEREAMAKDADRFRWLLDQELPDWMDLYHQHPDRVRERIDAQIEQERGEQAKEGA